MTGARAADRARTARLSHYLQPLLRGDTNVIEFFPETMWVDARVTGLAPLIAAWSTADLAEVPPEIRDEIMAHTALNLRSIAELSRLRHLLDGAEIRWFVAKGPVLGEVIYRQRGSRLYGDLDVFVHPDDFETALALIENSGATLLDRNWQHINATGQSEISLQLPHGTMLDLHWHPITDRRIRHEIDVDITTWFDRLQQVEIMGMPYPTLDPVDTVVYVCLHAILSGGHTLRWLVDIAECVAWAKPDAAVLRQRARQAGSEMAVQIMLGRVAAHLDPQVETLVGSRRRVWTLLAVLLDKVVPLDPSAATYSGRAFYSSTRRDTRRSVVAALTTVRRALSAGRRRRLGVVSAEVLRREAGTGADRRAWLDLVQRHGTVGDVTVRSARMESV